MAISDQLRAAVEGSGLTRHAIATAAGIPGPSLHRFMTGERGLTLETAAKLAAFFQMQLTKPKRPRVEG